MSGRSTSPGKSAPTGSRRAARVDLRRRAAGRNAQVEALLAGVSDDCRRLLEQLPAGATPITLGTESRLIRTRFAGGDDIVPLTNWLAEEFRQMGLDARIDTFPSSQGRDLPQVEATLVGADLKDEFVLITAHLEPSAGPPAPTTTPRGSPRWSAQPPARRADPASFRPLRRLQ